MQKHLLDLRALTFAYKDFKLRVAPSVPRSPTTDVIPFFTRSVTLISGVIEAKPCLPPAPVICTC